MGDALAFSARGEDDVVLALVDVGLARALWEGVPVARLLARVRAERDAADLATRMEGEGDESSWDSLLAQLVGGSPSALERVKRGVARHARAASDEGGLRADDAEVAALVHALLSAAEVDASAAEAAADAVPVDDEVRNACASIDERLGRVGGDRRAPAFEACLHLATLGSITPEPLSLLARELAPGIVPGVALLYPRGDVEVPKDDRRACLLDRAALERAPAVIGRSKRLASAVAQLLARAGQVVLFASAAPRSTRSIPPLPPSSWLPSDMASPDAASALAAALERGSTTVHRVRGLVLRGGDAALDQLGAEMLDVEAHPHASAAFAEILARAGRERDVIRLVTYFAIAPDPTAAARALALSPAPDLPSVLRGWLETMLPSEASPGEDREARARISACVAALAAYPHLHAAVASLLDAAGG